MKIFKKTALLSLLALTFSQSAMSLPEDGILSSVIALCFPESPTKVETTENFDDLGTTAKNGIVDLEGFIQKNPKDIPNYTEKYAKIGTIAVGIVGFLAKLAYDALQKSDGKAPWAAIAILVAPLLGTVLYDNWGKFEAKPKENLQGMVADVDPASNYGQVYTTQQLASEFGTDE